MEDYEKGKKAQEIIAEVPIIDLAGLNQSPHQRSCIIQQIRKACLEMGFFQIINHGISQSIIEGTLTSASDFFNLPAGDKNKFMSRDVHKPVRYSTTVTSLTDGVDSNRVQFCRVLLKHYAHPLDKWVSSWPAKPPHYREKMGRYCVEVQRVATEVMGAITESLGLGPTYLSEKMNPGVQVMAVNCYPPCLPQSDIPVLGLPPHCDYSCITILLQSCPGLQIMVPHEEDDQYTSTWKLVPDGVVQGTLQVHVGAHLEVLSNGLYKSVLHRVTLNSQRTRFSLGSLHSLAMDEKMECAEELVDDQLRPRRYKGSSFRDFLDFLSANDIGEGKSFIDTLRIKDQ
ncbi:2-oxoglutarate-dependent dioxygenase 21, chloroplastic [Macadamia integrifolia]|uniref:2-oxoglutarate-dependent dioxygenase 21, chloroplastic n=1 Tax=Macadamia integrifolia TaxID=60698 RepID=UPI001C4F6667|nr:2-oxoglutarate-dependent dioxygenase 21, chloroplastic [Macadamia integrifolia]